MKELDSLLFLLFTAFSSAFRTLGMMAAGSEEAVWPGVVAVLLFLLFVGLLVWLLAQRRSG